MIETALADAIDLIRQMDIVAAFLAFWPLFIFDIPRFTVASLAVGLTTLIEPKRPPGRPEVPVSVLLVGHNEAGRLEKSIRSLREQTQRHLQIVVVDDGSTDGMDRTARRLRQAGLIDDFRRTDLRGGKAAALNLGLQACRHDIIVSCDIDTSFDVDAVERIVAPLMQDPGLGAVGGNLAVRNHDTSLMTRFQAIEYYDNIGLGRQFLAMFGLLMIVSGAFGAFRRSAVQQADGWDVGPGDDSNLTIKLRRAGWRIGFAPDAWCLTNVPERDGALIRQRMRWDRSLIRNRVRKFAGIFDPFSAGFRWRDLAASANTLFFNVLLPFAYVLYLPYVLIMFGDRALTIFFALWIVYSVLAAFTFATCQLAVPRDDMNRLWLYVPGYSLYVAYFLRPIRVAACFTELAFRSSYEDSFYPTKVRRRVEQW